MFFVQYNLYPIHAQKIGHRCRFAPSEPYFYIFVYKKSLSMVYCVYAAIAQLVERIHGKDEVTGSNPVGGSIFYYFLPQWSWSGSDSR